MPNTRLDGKSKNDCTKLTYKHCITTLPEGIASDHLKCNVTY